MMNVSPAQHFGGHVLPGPDVLSALNPGGGGGGGQTGNGPRHIQCGNIHEHRVLVLFSIILVIIFLNNLS